jgi:hypothetical protein
MGYQKTRMSQDLQSAAISRAGHRSKLYESTNDFLVFYAGLRSTLHPNDLGVRARRPVCCRGELVQREMES